MLVLRAGEGMVTGHPAFFFSVVIEHREIDNPHRLPGLAVHVAFFVTNLAAQGTEGVVNHLGGICTKEDQVAILRTGTLNDGFQRGFSQVLHDRRLQAAFVGLRGIIDLDIGQALGPVDADKLGVGVNLAAREGCPTGDAQGGDTSGCAGGDTGENLERNILHHIGHFGQFERHAQVRLVGAVAVHGFGVGKAREGVGQIDVDGFLEHMADQVFHDAGDFRLA